MGELYGVYAAKVLDVRDPKRLGRVRVRLTAKEVAGLERRWARLATLMAGNGSAKPPERMDGAGKNPRRVLRTKGGHRLALDDGDQKIEITDANGNSIVLDAQGVRIQASAKLRVSASTIEIDAGMLTVNAGMSTFSGVVKCDSLITNSVVSSSYTPGAGNIW
jgi:hypothetical protein